MLARLTRHLRSCDEVLVPRSAVSRLEAAAAHLRDTNAELALECHLGRPTQRVDLVARLFPGDRDALLDAATFDPGLGPFLRRWAEPGDPLHQLPFVELEYDLDEAPVAPWIGPAVEPLVRRGLVAIFASRRERAVESWSSTNLSAAVVAALGLPDPEWATRITDCFRALPDTGCINHLTVLGARPRARTEGVRLIASLPTRSVETYLERVGFSGDAGVLRRLATRYTPFSERIDLDLDVELRGSAARTAFYVDFPAPRRESSVLRELLGQLADDGLMHPNEHEALAGWIQAVNGNPHHPLTLKVVSTPKSATCKAYLGALGRV